MILFYKKLASEPNFLNLSAALLNLCTWKSGRVVECNSIRGYRRLKSIEGSNPSSSANTILRASYTIAV